MKTSKKNFVVVLEADKYGPRIVHGGSINKVGEDILLPMTLKQAKKYAKSPGMDDFKVSVCELRKVK